MALARLGAMSAYRRKGQKRSFILTIRVIGEFA